MAMWSHFIFLLFLTSSLITASEAEKPRPIWAPVKTSEVKEVTTLRPFPVYRRRPGPLSSSSTTSSSTTSTAASTAAASASTSDETIEDDNNFNVGSEHYYDNRVDILKHNDDLEIEAEDEDDDDEVEVVVVYEDDDLESDDDTEYYYYYYDEEEDQEAEEEVVEVKEAAAAAYFRRKQRERAQRLRQIHAQRRAWLEKQRLQKYYASLSRWRRPPPSSRPKIIPAFRQPRRPKKKQQPIVFIESNDDDVKTVSAETNRRQYETQFTRGREISSSSAVAPESGTSGESTSMVRSILGVNPFCIHEDAQFSCTFTPLCWMSGGVASSGCDSMLYSCCVSHTIARRKDTFVGTGRAQKRRYKEILHNEPECGITKHRQFAKRIIGGQKAHFAELPWQVHIRISSYQCGGVLLNRHYVATAAHCVHQAKLSQITVHLGEFDTKDTEKVKEPLASESFRVDHITLHPDFRYMLTQPDRFDMALLKLDHPVEYQDNILPICLPTTDYDLVGKIGVVAGWGKTDNSFGKTGTNLLHKVLVPIIENGRCRTWHRDKAIAVQLHDEMFCAGHKGGKQDACLGDSGGPLVINFDGRWTLIGITSAGFGCAVEKQPGIYHKVSKTARWISQQINKDSPR